MNSCPMWTPQDQQFARPHNMIPLLYQAKIHNGHKKKKKSSKQTKEKKNTRKQKSQSSKQHVHRKLTDHKNKPSTTNSQ